MSEAEAEANATIANNGRDLFQVRLHHDDIVEYCPENSAIKARYGCEDYGAYCRVSPRRNDTIACRFRSTAPIPLTMLRRRSNMQIVQSAFARWSAGGNVFEELLAEDVVWTIHGSGSVAGTYNGLRDFTEHAARPLVSRLATPLVPRVDFMLSDCDRVIVRFGATATTASGQPYRNEFVWIFRMAAGHVVEAEAFLDLVAYQRVIESNEPHRGK